MSVEGGSDEAPVRGLERTCSIRDEFLGEKDQCYGEDETKKAVVSFIVIGASGDLAKKKTFPALFDLYSHDFFPDAVVITGYARSSMTDEELRDQLKPFLQDKAKAMGVEEGKVDSFLAMVRYVSGQYDSNEDFSKLVDKLQGWEKEACCDSADVCNNRLWYFAIPPNVFAATAGAIKHSGVENSGWTRIVVEKPFGHDLKSAQKLTDDLAEHFSEDHIYRIDHYLGKEMVQNVLTLRFSNALWEPVWNRNNIQSVQFTFKENFGTAGRGGYFDKYGIIRDVIQNHLIQVFSLIAMEPPVMVTGENYGNYVRDAKTRVLKSAGEISIEDIVLGQYEGNDDEPGYTDDAQVPTDSRTPTFCTCVMYVNNTRWEGVPFIFRAGKALNEKKSEVRLQFKDPPGSKAMFENECPRNELVLKLVPEENVYFKVNVKAPGLHNKPLQTELDLTYGDRFPDVYSPDAYTRLLLEVLRGNQAIFVRSDELLAAWEIFTPMLEATESKDSDVPLHKYAFGSRGPKESDELIKKMGYVYNDSYKWKGKAGPGKG